MELFFGQKLLSLVELLGLTYAWKNFKIMVQIVRPYFSFSWG